MNFEFDDEDSLNADEKRMLREARAANFRNELKNQAHERFMDMKKRFARVSGPNSMNRQSWNALFGAGANEEERRWKEREAQKWMVDRRATADERIAEQNRFGLEGQGVDAAKARAEADKAIAETNANAGIKKTEREWAGREQTSHDDLTRAELEWGRTGADGSRKAGGREAVADIEGRSRVDAAKEQAKIAAEANETKRALEEQKRIAAAEKEKNRLELRYKQLDAKTQKAIDAAANKIVTDSAGQVSFADARAQILAAREQSEQQGGGNVSTDSAGVKWQIVRDADGKPVGKRRVQ